MENKELREKFDKALLGLQVDYGKRIYRADRNFSALHRLLDFEIITIDEVHGWDLPHGSYYHIEASMLPQLRRCIGPLKVSCEEPLSKDKLRITVKAKENNLGYDFSDFSFEYDKAHTNDGKCKIVEEIIPSRTHLTLQCKVGE